MSNNLFFDSDFISCPVHGDEFLRECNICGNEFCTRCFPRSLACEECSNYEEVNHHDDESEEDLSDYEDLIEDDNNEIDRLMEESDLLPPEDLDDDDD